MGGHVVCVRLLLDAGADKNAADEVRRQILCLRLGMRFGFS
jgi:hypothetical protein